MRSPDRSVLHPGSRKSSDEADYPSDLKIESFRDQIRIRALTDSAGVGAGKGKRGLTDSGGVGARSRRRGLMVDLEASFLSDSENTLQSSDGEGGQQQEYAIRRDFERFQAQGLMAERDLLRKRLVMLVCMPAMQAWFSYLESSRPLPGAISASYWVYKMACLCIFVCTFRLLGDDTARLPGS